MRASYLIVLLCSVFVLKAQTQYNDKFTSVYVAPQRSFASLRTSGPQAGYLKDSLGRELKGTFGGAIGVQYRWQLKRTWFLNAGLEFQLSSFKRTMDSIPFGIKFHPDVPKNDQLISTYPGPMVDYRYRIYSVGVPLLFERQIFRHVETEEPWLFYLQLGITPQYIAIENLNLRLKGFTIDNKNEFKELETYLGTRSFNAYLSIAFAAYYKHSPKLGYFLQPMIAVPVLPVNSGDATYRLWQIGVKFGAYFLKDKDKK